MKKNIILCADDYAQNLAISTGILELVSKKKINAVSCVVNAPFWPEAGKNLVPFKKNIYVGLHFNLTMGAPASPLWRTSYGSEFSNLSTLVIKSYLHRLDPVAIDAEIDAQIEEFTHVMGMPPDFIDGHQHVHQLPIIRDRWLRFYQSNQCSFFFRNTFNGWGDFCSIKGIPKMQIIAFLGGLSFKNDLKKQSIPTNTSFAGIYNFGKKTNYGDHFRHFLTQSNDGGLIMCHPGLKSIDASDPLSLNRENEMDYFNSNQFLIDVEKKSFQLSIKQG